MKIDRNRIHQVANPFVMLLCQNRDLGQLVLDKRKDQSHVVRVLRGHKSRTKQEFFNEVSSALQFPYYFGENWDAFNECINDLEDWLPAASYLIVVSNADQLLVAEPRKEFDALIRILRRAEREWKSGLNHSRYVHASGEIGGKEKVDFTVALQTDLNADTPGNFSEWLEEVDIPKINFFE